MWLERQRHLRDRQERDRMSLGRLFRRDLLPVTIQTSVLMGAFIFSYHSITFWYPTFLASAQREPLRVPGRAQCWQHLGSILCGSAVGDRGSAAAAPPTLAMSLGVLATPLYLFAGSATRCCCRARC